MNSNEKNTALYEKMAADPGERLRPGKTQTGAAGTQTRRP